MNLHEADFHAWAWEQAEKLRRGEPIDRENIAEELEDLGRREQQQLENRLMVLIAHWLKWEFQPDQRCSSWAGTIREQQMRIEKLLGEMPSLKARMEEYIVKAYPLAVFLASTETKILEEDFPDECPYDQDQILRRAAKLP